jgi:predicted NAD/FAD-binding protein
MKKLAVIGSGIAGMSAAYFLRNDFEVTVFEKNNYVGGHTNTIDVKAQTGSTVSFDTGFMVFNEVTYPNFVKLMHELKVPYNDTDMSFSVKYGPRKTEYNGSSFSGLFAQRKNLFNFNHWKMILQINRFFKESPKILADENFGDKTIREYIDEQKFGLEFYQQFLVPMGSAVWSTEPGKMDEFPAKTLIRFFYNHGFMGLDTQHQCKTITGGSRTYRDKLIASFDKKIQTNCPARQITQMADHCLVKTDQGEYKFDKVIVATHADEALGLLQNPSSEQKRLLSCFKYSKNKAIVHTDSSVMPELRANWSSWNYNCITDKESFTVYYMNRLQQLKCEENYFININGGEFVNPKKVIQTIDYDHPLFSKEAIKAQRELDQLNPPNGPLNFCGSYFRYGFHEDALLSSVELCNSILGRQVL